MENKNIEIKNHITELFNKVAPVFDRDEPRFFAYFGERLVELAEIKKGEKVLDVATGKGASLFKASDTVGDKGEVIGIDISERMVDETRSEIEKRGLKNLKVLVMDAENLSFCDESFDSILCGFGVFFFPDYKVAINELKRVLKNNGIFGFTTFLRKKDERFLWFDEIVDKYLPPYEDELDECQESDAVDFHTEEGLYKILSENGFKNIKILQEEKEFVYKTEKEWWDKLWSHGFIEVLERIPEDKMDSFKNEVFHGLKKVKEVDGIKASRSVLYGFGTK